MESGLRQTRETALAPIGRAYGRAPPTKSSLFAALDVKTGEVIGGYHRRLRQGELLRFLRPVDRTIKAKHPEGTAIHIVLDNYATHKTPAVKRWFSRRSGYRLHFTPTSASWLNQVERFFAEITNKRIRRGVFTTVQALESVIREYLEIHNPEPQPFNWTADAARNLGCHLFPQCHRSRIKNRRQPSFREDLVPPGTSAAT